MSAPLQVKYLFIHMRVLAAHCLNTTNRKPEKGTKFNGRYFNIHVISKEQKRGLNLFFFGTDHKNIFIFRMYLNRIANGFMEYQFKKVLIFMRVCKIFFFHRTTQNYLVYITIYEPLLLENI